MDIQLNKEEVESEKSVTGENKVELQVRVSRQAVDREVEKMYEQVKKNIDIPGFRKGNVPMEVVKKKYSSVVEDDLRQEFINESLQQAAGEHDIEPVGEPNLKEEPDGLPEKKDLTYTVEIETKPEVEVGNYDEIELEREEVTATDEEVENAIEQARLENAELNWVEEGTIQEDDLIVTDIDVTVDGEDFASDTNHEIQVDDNMDVFGIHHPDLKEQLIGLETDREHHISLRIPDDTEMEELAGEQLELTLTIHEIKRPDLPPLDEDFFQQFDCETEEEFRDQVREEVETQKKNEQEQELKEEAMEAVIERADFSIPDALLNRGYEEFLQNQRMRMSRAGLPDHIIDEQIEENREETRQQIEDHLKRNYVVDAIAEREKIFVTEKEVDEYINQLASEQDMFPAELEERLEEQGQMEQLRGELKEKKVLDFLMDEVSISTTTPEE